MIYIINTKHQMSSLTSNVIIRGSKYDIINNINTDNKSNIFNADNPLLHTRY